MKPKTKLTNYIKERIIEISKPYAYKTGQQDGRIWELTRLQDKINEVLE